jgi:hypothetical protein
LIPNTGGIGNGKSMERKVGVKMQKTRKKKKTFNMAI